MVIAIASFALVVDANLRRAGCALGSVGPVPLRAGAAESFLGQHVDWDHLTMRDPSALGRFGELVAESARPIDDHRGTAIYRRHAVRVLAQRAAAKAFLGGAPA
jgi:CO/xanthine dehydrogenase FAD-binding subunit